MADDILKLSNISKTYSRGAAETEVLHGIDLVLRPGDFAALMGPSGSGKSTLLHIMGLLERPTGGSVKMLGRECVGMDETLLTRLRGKSIGFVFQFHYLIPAFSALENVMMPLMLEHGRPSDDIRDRAALILTRMGLANKLHSRPVELSGGQQQRVAIARALANEPRLVLADEPTGNLDSSTASEIFSLLRTVNEESGATFLIVTHDIKLASRCCRTIEVLDGRIVSGSGDAACAP